MQTTNTQHNLNIASTEETFCVVCYDTCNTKLSCCKQEICNGCKDIAEYLRSRKTIKLKIYNCINEYWKWFNSACNKKLFGKIIETLDIEYNNLISEIEKNY